MASPYKIGTPVLIKGVAGTVADYTRSFVDHEHIYEIAAVGGPIMARHSEIVPVKSAGQDH